MRDDIPKFPRDDEPPWEAGRIIDTTVAEIQASASLGADELVPTENWGIQIARLCNEYDGVYTDTGYHQLFPRPRTGDPGRPSAEELAARREVYVRNLNALLATYPRLAKKLMYGSDWHMTVATEAVEDFLPNFARLSNSLDIDPYDLFIGNAARFLPDDAFDVPIPSRATWEAAYCGSGMVVIPRKD